MQRIGRALHINSNKNIILKAEKLPEIGCRVVDKNQKSVGTVFDIFGPVSAPYISVKPYTEETHHLVNHFLFIAPSVKSSLKNKKKKEIK